MSTTMPSLRILPAVVLAGLAAIAAIAAAAGGGTAARLTLAITLPIAVGVWINTVRAGRPPALVLGVLALLAAVGSLHVALTSPTAAWAYDSHMVPSVLLPSASARISVAWTVPLLWVAAFGAMAVAAHRRVGAPIVALLLLGVGAAPLLVGNAFPTDAYWLLWDSTALGHASYATGACAIFLVMALTDERAARRFNVSEAR